MPISSLTVQMSPLFLLALLACLPAGLQAQAVRGTESPEAAFRAFYDAFGRQRWDEAVGLLDVRDLDAYRRQRAAAARSNSVEDLTVEDVLRGDPNMPRAVAEYQVERFNRERVRTGNYLSFEFAGVRDPDELDSLPLHEVAVRWLAARHPETRLRDQLIGMGCSLPPNVPLPIPVDTPLVVGAVQLGDSSAVVLFAAPGMPPPSLGYFAASPLIASLRRTAAGWRVLARQGLMEGMGTYFQLTGCPEKRPPEPPDG